MRTLVCLVICCCWAVSAAAQYATSDEAMRAAGPLLRNRQYAEAKAPLEAAYRLAQPQERNKRVAAEALMVVYRELREPEKLLEMGDYLIAAAERKAGRSVLSTSITSFLHQNGMLDMGIQRYEERRMKTADDIVALSVLAKIYSQSSRKDDTKAKEIAGLLKTQELKLAAEHATRLEALAKQDATQRAWLLKDAAELWLEAESTAQAVTTAKAAIAAGPEGRNSLLTMQWHQSLGDVFLASADAKLAVEHYEAALQAAPSDPLKDPIRKKLESAKQQVK